MKLCIPCIVVLVLCGCNSDPEALPEKNSRLQVYPNPFSDIAYVTFDNPSAEEFTLVLFGTEGEVLFERQENVPDANYQINLSQEPKGTYHVILEIDGTTIRRQVFKR